MAKKHKTFFSEMQAETIYAMGHSAYENGQYQKAATIFAGLAANVKNNPKYWMGLGSADFMAKRYDRAAHAFLLAAAQKPHNPEPYIRAAESLWHQKEVEKAYQMLLLAETAVKNNKKEFGNFMDQIILYKQAWLNPSNKEVL